MDPAPPSWKQNHDSTEKWRPWWTYIQAKQMNPSNGRSSLSTNHSNRGQSPNFKDSKIVKNQISKSTVDMRDTADQCVSAVCDGVFHHPILPPAGLNRTSWYILSSPHTLALSRLTHPPPPHTHIQIYTHMQTSCCSAGWQSAPVPVVRTEQLPSRCPPRLSAPAAAEPAPWRIWVNEGNAGEMLKAKLDLTL